MVNVLKGDPSLPYDLDSLEKFILEDQVSWTRFGPWCNEQRQGELSGFDESDYEDIDVTGSEQESEEEVDVKEEEVNVKEEMLSTQQTRLTQQTRPAPQAVKQEAPQASCSATQTIRAGHPRPKPEEELPKQRTEGGEEYQKMLAAYASFTMNSH